MNQVKKAKTNGDEVAKDNKLYEDAWAAYLRNDIPEAAFLATQLIEVVTAARNLYDLKTNRDKIHSDRLVSAGDMWYIRGALDANNATYLQTALENYDDHISIMKSINDSDVNVKNALKMKAETLLRLHRYKDAMETFDRVANAGVAFEDEHEKEGTERTNLRSDEHKNESITMEDWLESEIAPFRVKHDALQRKYLGRAKEAGKLLDLLEDWKQNTTTKTFEDAESKRLQRTLVGAIADESIISILWELGIGRLRIRPELNMQNVDDHLGDFFLTQRDWSLIEKEFKEKNIVIIDDFFTPEYLEMIYQYTLRADIFKTQRAGFLGAFPSDGANHPTFDALVHEMESSLPNVLGEEHPLGLWWFFKYVPGYGDRGIGVHADQAAVNLNIWITPNEGCISGGGLEIFSHVPPAVGINIREYNQEFSSLTAELNFMADLRKKGTSTLVPYKRNRAVLFVSDQYHVSEPFVFKDEYEHFRCNLTFLFGDRLTLDKTMHSDNGEKLAAQKEAAACVCATMTTSASSIATNSTNANKVDKDSDIWGIFD